MPGNELATLKPPLIVELVGPAGAGKTTLAQALSQRDKSVTIAPDLEVRRWEHFRIFIIHLPLLLPVLLCRYRRSRWFTWNEVKAMVYLKAWPRVLRQQAANHAAVIILDHGPVFKLATLNGFGPEMLKNRGFEKWWNGMFIQWASTLNMVIWLDGLDTILMERINTRSQKHAVKGKSEQAASKFLAQYRTSYQWVLAELTASGGPTPLQFDTSQLSVEQIAHEVLSARNREPVLAELT